MFDSVRPETGFWRAYLQVAPFSQSLSMLIVNAGILPQWYMAPAKIAAARTRAYETVVPRAMLATSGIAEGLGDCDGVGDGDGGGNSDGDAGLNEKSPPSDVRAHVSAHACVHACMHACMRT